MVEHLGIVWVVTVAEKDDLSGRSGRLSCIAVVEIGIVLLTVLEAMMNARAAELS